MGMADEEQQVVEQEVEVAEEEADLVDPMVEIKEKCSQTKACAALFEKLTSCNTRVASKTETTETCVEEESICISYPFGSTCSTNGGVVMSFIANKQKKKGGDKITINCFILIDY